MVAVRGKLEEAHGILQKVARKQLKSAVGGSSAEALRKLRGNVLSGLFSDMLGFRDSSRVFPRNLDAEILGLRIDRTHTLPRPKSRIVSRLAPRHPAMRRRT